MNINSKATPQNTSIADQIARAATQYARRANAVGTGMSAKSIGGGGVGVAVMGGGGLGAAAMRGLSPEAAREMLSRNQGKLGALLEAHLKSKAGPVK